MAKEPTWIAYDPSQSGSSHNREQFNGDRRDWLDTQDETDGRRRGLPHGRAVVRS